MSVAAKILQRTIILTKVTPVVSRETWSTWLRIVHDSNDDASSRDNEIAAKNICSACAYKTSGWKSWPVRANVDMLMM